MALDRKRLQKKKAKRAAKAKSRRLKADARQPMEGGRKYAAVASALNAPVYECWMPAELFEPNRGIGTVVVSRKSSGGDILAATFLLDVFCLGIKDTFLLLMSGEDYTDLVDQFRGDGPLEAIPSSCARKLVTSAEAYARSIGLPPHKGYRWSSKIFGDIEASDCPRSFTFGSDGKPLFVAGPYDGPGKVKRVMRTLEKHCGRDGFHFVAAMSPPDF